MTGAFLAVATEHEMFDEIRGYAAAAAVAEYVRRDWLRLDLPTLDVLGHSARRVRRPGTRTSRRDVGRALTG